MPSTIEQGFKTLRQNLEITELQAKTASVRQKTVRDAIEAEMDVLDSFLAGSYNRSTMIAPLKQADIDIFIILASKYYEQSGQASLLDKVKRVLKKTYPQTPAISRNGQAVTITFTDFKVDVVPGFYAKGGGYLIPDSVSAKWIRTDPKKHIDIWSEANKAHGGDLIPLIKMIKGWNKSHSALFRSFHLETATLQVLTNVTISDFPSGARFVFDKLVHHIELQNSDPSGYGGDVGAYMTGQLLKDAQTRLESACEKAKSAEQLAAQGKILAAYGKWQVIFGDYFPAYE